MGFSCLLVKVYTNQKYSVNFKYYNFSSYFCLKMKLFHSSYFVTGGFNASGRAKAESVPGRSRPGPAA